MKFTADRDQLLGALQKVQSVIEKKGSVQILANILCAVSAEEKELSLSATDLEVGIKVSIPIQDVENGRITLSGKHFLDIVKELPSQPIQITRKENDWVEIVSGKSKFNIVSLPADEYPSMPQFEEKDYFESKVTALSEMVSKTAFAISNDATRYHLNGVFFEKQDDASMRMVACDGHRLSFIDKEVFLKVPEFKRGIIIPKKGLNEFKKLLDDAPESIELAFERGYFFVHSEKTYLFIRLIEGEYPDYKQVIPKSNDKVAEIDRETFHSALKRVSLLAHEKSRGVKFNFEKNALIITSSNPDMGEAREEIEIEYDGDQVDIGFNAKYILDCLPSMDSEKLEFRFKDRLSPGVLKNTGQETKKDHTYVVMPMRI